jgi:shikimate kinase
MGSGKTTVGKQLAKELNMTFLDMDEKIQQDIKKSIQEIFQQKGEPFFRAEEQLLSEKISVETNLVVATGGGVILKQENMDNLSRNGIILFLKCDFDVVVHRIKNEKYRPLFSLPDIQKFEKLFHSREHLYKKYADFTVTVDKKTTDGIITEILQKIKIKN